MKYSPDQIKEEFKIALSKRNLKNKNKGQEFNRAIYNFIYEKVFKDIKKEDCKEVGDLIMRVFTDTTKFVFDYGIVIKEVLSEFRSTPGFKEQLIEDLKKESKLNKEHKDLITEVLRLKRYKSEDMEEQEKEDDPDA